MALTRSASGPGKGKNYLDSSTKMEAIGHFCNKFLKSNTLALALLVGVLVGFVLGLGLNSIEPKMTKLQITYLRFPGDIFIQMMKMLLIPIVVSSLLCSIAETDIKSSGKIGLRAMVYYLGTMLMASLLATLLAVTIRPGERTAGSVNSGSTEHSIPSSPGVAFMDLVRNMVPDNLVESCFASKRTTFRIKPNGGENSTDLSNETAERKTETVLQTEKVNGVNVIGLVVASIVFGLVTSAAGAEARPFLDFFKAFRCVTFRLVNVFIWFSPVGICFLIAPKLAEMDDPVRTIADLALFVACAVTGFAIHGFVIVPLLYLIVVRKNPLLFLTGMLPALIFAFSSNSSAATLPLTIKCMEERNRVDPRVTKLIASVGATINMDGSCIYFPTMTIFVAQLHGIPLSAGQIVAICVLAVSIAMGAAGVPSPGSTYTIMMLTGVGLPLDDIGTLLAVDFLVERCVTVVNVMGDAHGAGIVAHLSRHELPKVNLPVTDVPDTSRNQDGDMDILLSPLKAEGDTEVLGTRNT